METLFCTYFRLEIAKTFYEKLGPDRDYNFFDLVLFGFNFEGWEKLLCG